MLWIIDDHQRPRPCIEAKFIQLVPRRGQSGGGTTCFIATAALGSPDHPKVIYLQGLREHIRVSSHLGKHFIHVVNAVYGTFSPKVARRIESDIVLRDIIRRLVVRPVVKLIGATDRLTQHFHSQFRHPILITALTLEACLSVAMLPLFASVLVVCVGLKKFRDRYHSDHVGE